MNTRVSVIGMGFFGRILADTLRSTPNVDVVAVYDRNPEKGKKVDLKGAHFYSDLKTMFATEPMDATVVAEIPGNHVAPTLLAAEKGVHVFCEKPMANTLAECDQMIEACDKHHVKLMIGFKHRYAKAMAQARSELPRLGRPLWGMYTYPLWKVEDSGWKFDENGTRGIIVENMVHAFDIMRSFFGDMRTLYAEGNNYVYQHPTLADSAVLVARFENGAIGAIGGGCTSDQRVTREYLDMHFERGIMQVSGMLDQPYDLRVFMRDDGKPEDHHYEGSDGVREEMAHFVECVRENKQTRTTGIDGKKALEIALCCLESIQTKKVVTIGAR